MVLFDEEFFKKLKEKLEEIAIIISVLMPFAVIAVILLALLIFTQQVILSIITILSR